jgi:aryl-alcohol dehydrogenase-like predicted oxidoreductase
MAAVVAQRVDGWKAGQGVEMRAEMRALALGVSARSLFRGEDPANVGLAWLLHQEGVTAPIIGPRTIEQLDNSLRAAELKLDADVLGKLDELFPAPAPNGSKPAPEAYAW